MPRLATPTLRRWALALLTAATGASAQSPPGTAADAAAAASPSASAPTPVPALASEPATAPESTPAPTPSSAPVTPPASLAQTRALAALRANLPPPVADALRRANLPADALAAIVMPAGKPGPLAQRWLHQADRPMQPASTMKLLTSIVALDRLGPNLRGHTELWTTAPVVPGKGPDDGTLQGDLILRGGADPELALPQLWALLSELRWQGIGTLAGDIVLDRTLFRPGRIDRGLPPFDEWPEFAYNGIPDAAQINDSLMGLEIRSDGLSIQARPLPPLPGISIDTSGLRFSNRACKDWDDDWITPPRVQDDGQGHLTVTLQGGFPRHCVQRPHLALIDRDLLAERQLRWVWQSLGGQWTGRLRDADNPTVPTSRRLPDPLANLLRPNPAAPSPSPAPNPMAATGASSAAAKPVGTATGTSAEVAAPAPRLLARRQSRPWGELLRTLNKQSDNLLTRLIYLQLGVNAMAAEPQRATAELAEREVRRWLDGHRIAAPGLVLDNGSGLSRSERISPRTLAQALQVAHESRWGSELVMSLPLVGVDGTMRNRLRGSVAGGWARMKTGTLKNTTALAGYVPDAQGRLWVVASMVNHDRAAEGRAALDALVDWVAQGGMRGPWRGAAD